MMDDCVPDIDYSFVKTSDHARRVSELAVTIWRHHFVPIIGQAQVDYMLVLFQSAAAIEEQCRQGYRYYIVTQDGHDIGYFAFLSYPDRKELFLSKLYIHHRFRKKGFASKIISFIQSQGFKQGLKRMQLTVNKKNRGAISFYEKLGFTKKESVVKDIGYGFVMDDYLMEKNLNPKP